MAKEKKQKKKAQLPIRLNILFFIVFLMFSVLILQLGFVQILNGDSYRSEIERTIQDTTENPVPRGKIVDRNHKVIVDNKALYSITYTPAKGVQAKERLDVAEKLANFISMDTKSITDRDKREYWYLKHTDEAESRLSDEEAAELDNAEQYKKILEAIKDDEIKEFSKDELQVIAIKKELDKAYSLTPQTIKNKDVTPDEYAQVAEHLDELPGVNATMDWDREFNSGETFSSLIGSITSKEQGIPADKEDYFLTRGYSRNDRVGKSGLEEYYEDLLRGRKEKIEHTTTKNGTILDSKTLVEGQRGKDLVLSIDIDYQEKVDKIVRDELKKAKASQPYDNRLLQDALAVAINPKTGELLAVSGQHYDKEKGKYTNAAYKALYDAHVPGSSIKGATILAGLQSGVISPGETIYDSPIKIKGTKQKGSLSKNIGLASDTDALKKSSNVYMFYIALRIGGENRYPFPDGASARFDTAAFQKMRNYYGQFGLGVQTGIDYPYESVGYEGGVSTDAGLLMNLAIGQFDTYTTLQLAQYVSTIANDGYRVRPHFLNEVRQPIGDKDKLGPVFKSVDTDVMNRIQMQDSYIQRVQEGFRRAFQEQGGTGYSYWAGKSYNPVGKTGTAESFYKDGDNLVATDNYSLVGYAPGNEPEIAFAVIVPYLGKNNQYKIQHNIGTRLMDAYFDLKEKRDDDDKEKVN
jgi:cell division protein FtsI/penicillin-binding protein 2